MIKHFQFIFYVSSDSLPFPSHLQYNIPLLDVAIPGCQALRGNVLDKDVAGQAQAIFCLQSERQQQRQH